MNRDSFHDDAEARENKLCDLLTAGIKSIHLAVLVGHKETIQAVAEGLEGLECGAEEAEALVRAAVVGHSALVGLRIASEVEAAIYFLAESRAEKEVAGMDGKRASSTNEYRIDMVEFDRAIY